VRAYAITAVSDELFADSAFRPSVRMSLRKTLDTFGTVRRITRFVIDPFERKGWTSFPPAWPGTHYVVAFAEMEHVS
jgi:hypothetical protein